MFNRNDFDYYNSKIGNSSAQDDSGHGQEEGSYKSCLSWLREKHDFPDFKLCCGRGGGKENLLVN